MDKNLRLIAGQIVVESKMSKFAKIQLLNFIKEEATDTQIKALLMDGKIVKLDEQAEQIVNERFELLEAGGRIAQMRKTGSSLAGVAAGMGAFWGMYRLIRGALSKCTRKCGTLQLNTARRQTCLYKCKLDAAKAKLDALVKTKADENKLSKAKAAYYKAQVLFNKSVKASKSA